VTPQFETVQLTSSCSYYLVSYVDLLGQGAPLQAIADRRPNEAEELAKVFGPVVTHIRFLRDAFFIFAKAMAAGPVPDGLPAEHFERFRRFRKVDAGIRTFSDSLVLTSKLEESDEFGRWGPIYSIQTHLNGLATILVMGLASKIPIRVGTSLSIGMELDGEYLGPALGEAYDLERKIADYPRVVVHQRVRRVLISHAQRHDPEAPEPAIDAAAARIAGEMASVLRPISPTADMLDVIHPLFTAAGGAFSVQNLADARAFAFDQHAEHQATGDTKLATRYAQLLSYFNGAA